MKIEATHSPQNDNLRLNESEPFCNLARAMIKRAFMDSVGKVGVEHASRGDKKFLIIKDAQTFMSGPGFRHWCELLGANPDDMLVMIKERGRAAD